MGGQENLLLSGIINTFFSERGRFAFQFIDICGLLHCCFGRISFAAIVAREEDMLAGCKLYILCGVESTVCYFVMDFNGCRLDSREKNS